MRISSLRAPMLGAFALFFAAICALTLLSSVVEAAPTISGTPKTRFGVNGWYSFQPAASDPASRSPLRYSIVNKPSWAKFSVQTGRLEGATPARAGTYSNIRISVRSSTGTASLPPFSIQVYSPTGGDSGSGSNRPPVVSGTPATSITAGSAYSFRPTGSDPEGRTLTWSISNRPSWAAFNTSTGALTGTPSASNVGTFSNIVISASDGANRTSLRAFNIAVTAAGSNSGSASLSWTPPTTNTNGTQLSNLAGYRIYYGTSPTNLSRTVQLSNAGLTRYVISDLSPATYYFSIRAYNSSGTESSGSNVVTKVVR
ncbi:fibronectin type III domain-containing protein [Steroidobacter sp. S1-65]|uniref:Fibronectin type III domain-containing protein n=1 Tax=Steroidobacter gossypii TaxID=2805490 RepID=A0ABS1WTH4_9GAMM|nr:putative Ig domain-containing protein [Steroidobacter gossypii]MBM0104243.1 fibronectin type III domain-containing protein [Steroidobacter gossypii]